MARNINENKNMALSALLREEDNNSDDNQRNYQVVTSNRGNSRLRLQQRWQRLNQLRAENKMLEDKLKFLEKEIRFLKKLFVTQARISQINLSRSVLKTLMSDTTSDILKNDLTKSQSSS
ncbi:hypothetical protein QTP88_029035 [Uroleucon formosanum]